MQITAASVLFKCLGQCVTHVKHTWAVCNTHETHLGSVQHTWNTLGLCVTHVKHTWAVCNTREKGWDVRDSHITQVRREKSNQSKHTLQATEVSDTEVYMSLFISLPEIHIVYGWSHIGSACFIFLRIVSIQLINVRQTYLIILFKDFIEINKNVE